MPRPLLSFLLAALLWPAAQATPARAQDPRRFDQAGLQELSEEVEVLQIAYGALLAQPGRSPEGGLNGVQRGRAQRVHRALQIRTRILRRPNTAGSHIRGRLEAERAQLLRPLWDATSLLSRRGLGGPAEAVRGLAERWKLSLSDAAAVETKTEAEPEPAARPLPDLEQLTTRVWILRLARQAHAARGAEHSVRLIDSALRYAELRLEGAPWSEEAVALSRVAPPERLAQIVERAAEHFDQNGETRRARICMRLVRFYRGEPQVQEAPLPSKDRARTAEQEHNLRVAIAAREAHLLAGEMAGFALLDRFARNFGKTGTTELPPPQIAALLARAAELHREHGFPQQAEAAEKVIEQLLGTGPYLESLRQRVERLEAELREARRKRR